MKRTAFAIVCVSLVLVLAGCNVWSIIWQGIIGKGYYQLTQSSIVNSNSNMTSSPIDLTTLTTSSVIIYKTGANGLYGKLVTGDCSACGQPCDPVYNLCK